MNTAIKKRLHHLTEDGLFPKELPLILFKVQMKKKGGKEGEAPLPFLYACLSF